MSAKEFNFLESSAIEFVVAKEAKQDAINARNNAPKCTEECVGGYSSGDGGVPPCRYMPEAEPCENCKAREAIAKTIPGLSKRATNAYRRLRIAVKNQEACKS